MFNLAEAVDVCESHAQCRAFVVTNQTTWTGEPVRKDILQEMTVLDQKRLTGSVPHQKPEIRGKCMCPPGSCIRKSGPASRERNTQSCYLSPLPSGRQLVFFKTGWSHVVPDPNKTTYVRASG